MAFLGALGVPIITKREREFLAIDDEFEAMAERAARALYDFDHAHQVRPPMPLLRVTDPEVIETYKRRARGHRSPGPA
jgi:hypothetical protein